jgi:flagellar assembly protein FliH
MAASSAARKPDLAPRVEAAIAALKLQGERLAEQARSDALEVGLLIARRVLERELSTNIDALFGQIKSAIARIGDARRTVVRLSPEDRARLQDADPSTFTLGRVDIVADETLSPGDVVVDADDHSIDGRLSTQLEEIARSLKEDPL